jgi:hypothetical protein
MTGYVQYPTGWWQDRKGRMQPPGSFLDPSLRVIPAARAKTERPTPTKWARRWMATVRGLVT